LSPTTRSIVPVHNIVDDVTWTKGTHSIQFGANVRIINDGRAGNIDSFNFAQTNVSWLDTAGIANKRSDLNPCASQFASLNLPCVSDSFDQSYDLSVAAIAGLVPLVEGEYNREESPRRVWDAFSPPKFGYPEAKGQTYQLTSEQYAVNEVSQSVFGEMLVCTQ